MSDEALTIRSRTNAVVRDLRRLLRGAGERERAGAFVASGVRLVEEALASDVDLECALSSARLLREPRGRTLAGRLRARARRFETTTDAILGWALETERHQGVAVRARLPGTTVGEVLDAAAHPLLTVAWGIQDPGNLGGLVRVTAAAGGSGVLAAGGSADPYNPKAVRASAGALFRLPAVRAGDGRGLLEDLLRGGYRILAATARGGLPPAGVDWAGPLALLLGGEGDGLPGDVLARATARVTLPMAPGAESLNVLSAATLLLYEAASRRGLLG